MAKFVRKSDKIEAFKWIKNTKQTELPIWIIEAIKNGDIWFGVNSKEAVIFVRTIVGTYEANIGDYIIQRKEGELYPCNAQEFEELYEKVEYTVTIENLTNYAENLEQKHRYIDKEKVKKNNLEFSAKLELDTTDFEENIKNATKEIDIFNEAVSNLEENLNRIFGKEKINETKIKIKSPTKQLSNEDLEYIRETAYKDIKARFAKEGKIKIDY
ncbi:hypothetical protein [Clostridioides difficile]|uniref:hypothetical protein n=1 Tax=Clostridioides difficile TaxID=1496 RepID=UPI001C1C0D18|nr:hypothetical protein [Clostridioides difficile]MCR1515731.1 hypothetical protein [Clostridioides difficile]WID69314.1 hypothetical protein ITJ29_10065 [Clostridioides difficile]HBG0426697.1 hypothetical protein [Clostridioides difficile]HBG2124644.1 hypothetical protein [Clostridioides difficile]